MSLTDQAFSEQGDLEQTIASLIKDLVHDEQEKRDDAESRLIALGELALPLLISSLADTTGNIAFQVTWVLAKIGSLAIPALIEALKNEDIEVRSWTAIALGHIADPRAIHPLIDALKDSNEDVREYAVSALGKIGDKIALPALLSLQTRETDEYVQEKLVKAIEALNKQTL